MSSMTLAVASGKGGTGKSSVSASLVASVPGLLAVDADVEEPNLRLLLDAEPFESSLVSLRVPAIDDGRCSRCGQCVSACMFGALTMFGDSSPQVNDLCHGCGLCSMVCPEGAITEIDKPIGEIRHCRTARGVELYEGRLNVGLPNPVPVIEDLVKVVLGMDVPKVIDCAPGNACPMVAGIRHSDAVLLVTEPTPFGAADLDLALQAVVNLGKPVGIIINRSDLAAADIRGLASKYGSPVLAEFPFSRAVAEAYAEGTPPAAMDARWESGLREVWEYFERKLDR
ncbi:MAG: 4Fe-4S binding protein [Thermovirgaceae bacterium]